MCTMYVPGAFRGKKRALDPETGVIDVLRSYVGAKN